MSSPQDSSTNTGPCPRMRARQSWMSVLSKAAPQDMGLLEAAWEALDPKPETRVLRPPETGLVMVRGRAGGRGGRFNLGEMTMTRCAVLVNGTAGFGYVAGRRPRHSELAALFDGLLQDENQRDRLMAGLIQPLKERATARRAQIEAKAAATRVEFFTMVRGED